MGGVLAEHDTFVEQMFDADIPMLLRQARDVVRVLVSRLRPAPVTKVYLTAAACARGCRMRILVSNLEYRLGIRGEDARSG